jgi:hypothetical protein
MLAERGNRMIPGDPLDPTTQLVSPIGIKEPGLIGVMEPFSGEENGHP